MNTSNIFGFEETEKMGLRKGVVFYFNDWIDEKIISILEEIVEQFLSLTQAQFTKKRSGENDAYVNRRNIRGGWKKVFHRAFDNFDDSNILILDNCTPQQLQTIYTCIKQTNYRGPSHFGVPCPNFIQILCSELTQKMASEIPDELHGKLVNTNLFLDILDRNLKKCLSRHWNR